MVGGSEPPPAIGHLSGGEPIVKPTQRSVLFFAEKGWFLRKDKKGFNLLQVEGR